MGIILKKLIRLFLGFLFCAMGIAFMVNANLGLSPWNVLHQGIANKIGITIGTATIAVGFILVIIDVILGEKIGWGTILNMIFIGMFLDIILFSGLIPVSNNLWVGIVMLIIGMTLMGFGMVLYLGSELGSGPRDGMMIAFQKITKKPIKIVRGTMEISALMLGYLLGGPVGIGTLITAFCLGHFIQLVFKICNFKSDNIKHRFIYQDIEYAKSYLSKNT